MEEPVTQRVHAWRRALCAAALAVFLSSGPVAAQERLKIAAGQRGNWDSAISEVGQRGGIFRKHGLEVEVLFTEGGGETLQAVLSRSVDIGAAVGIMGVLGAFSKGAPVRIIGGEMIGASDTYWYVRSDSPVRTVRDIAGRTIGYSTNGSSTHGQVLALLEQYRLTARPTATGAASSTLTQVMSGQIEVGYSAPPFGLAQLDRGQIRIVARGDDIAIFKDQTVRVLIAHPQVLQTRRAAIARYLRGYRETIAWMYRDPEALRTYARFVNIPEAMARRTRDGFFPVETVNPDRVVGMDRIMQQAVRFKYIAAPLTQAQVAQLIQIPPRRGP